MYEKYFLNIIYKLRLLQTRSRQAAAFIKEFAEKVLDGKGSFYFWPYHRMPMFVWQVKKILKNTLLI